MFDLLPHWKGWCYISGSTVRLLGLLKGVRLLCLLQAVDVWQHAWLSKLSEAHVVFLAGGLRGRAITIRPHNLHLFISKTGIPLFFSLISVYFPFCTRQLLVFFGDERHLFSCLQRVTQHWKSLVLQSCSVSILNPILRWWSKRIRAEGEVKCLRDVCSGVNNNTDSLGRHVLIPGREIIIFAAHQTAPLPHAPQVSCRHTGHPFASG